MDIQKGWNVAQVKEADMAKVYRLLEEHRFGYHISCYEVP